MKEAQEFVNMPLHGSCCRNLFYNTFHYFVNEHNCNNRLWWEFNTGCVSESGNFATLFFSGSATLGRMSLSPFCCQSILVAMEPWPGAQRAFAVKAFYKDCDSFVIAQREF
jgi:hypothetical protein